MLDQPTRTMMPKTWLAEPILVTIFCCLPFGIVGIVNSSKVESRFRIGDYDGADQASAEAKKWTMIGFWVGLVCIVLYFIFVGSALFFAAKNGGLEQGY